MRYHDRTLRVNEISGQVFTDKNSTQCNVVSRCNVGRPADLIGRVPVTTSHGRDSPVQRDIVNNPPSDSSSHDSDTGSDECSTRTPQRNVRFSGGRVWDGNKLGGSRTRFSTFFWEFVEDDV